MIRSKRGRNFPTSRPAKALARGDRTLSRLVPRYRLGEVFAVTLLAWHRRLVARTWDYTSRCRPGRPSTTTSIRKPVIRMARGPVNVMDKAGDNHARHAIRAPEKVRARR